MQEGTSFKKEVTFSPCRIRLGSSLAAAAFSLSRVFPDAFPFKRNLPEIRPKRSSGT